METEKDKAPKKEAKAEVYKVFDAKAGDKGRTHEIIVKKYTDGREPEIKPYTLFAHTAVEMPADHAMKFLIDPTFRVERSNGQRITPPPKYDPSLPLTVGEDQTIANFDELSKTALYKRAKLIAGSENLTVNSSIDELVDFLKAQRRKTMRGDLTDRERELLEKLTVGELDGQLGGAAVSKLFGEDSPLVAEVNRAADAQRAAKAA